MEKTLAALSFLIFLPSIAAAQFGGATVGEMIVNTGNRNIAVHLSRNTSPLVVGVQNHSSDYVRCSAMFSHLPIIYGKESVTIAPGGTAALRNRDGYRTARIDVEVSCV